MNNASMKPKRQPPQPVPCLAAVAAPVIGQPLCYQWQPLGLFASRAAGRRAVEAARAENPALTFVVLPQTLAGQEPFYDALAAALAERGEA